LKEDGDMQRTFTAYIEFDEESKLYVGIIHAVPGAYSQGETLEELEENLKEVLALCLNRKSLEIPEIHSRFVGVKQIEVAI
jgi:predicted RNase H-like HicB family nuclease